jgi:hypothetical protein
MNKLLPVLLIAAFTARLIAEEKETPLRLSPQEIQLLDDFAALKPGMPEEELRQRLPELSASYKEKPRPLLTFAATSMFQLAGMQWHGIITFADGRLLQADLHASAWKVFHPKLTGQAIPLHKVRAIELLVTTHYISKFGKVTEKYVPNTDCPAGNPFGLRHQWHRKDTVLSVEFAKNASMSWVEILIADWAPWEKEQREYDREWPLTPTPKHLLLEVSKP